MSCLSLRHAVMHQNGTVETCMSLAASTTTKALAMPLRCQLCFLLCKPPGSARHLMHPIRMLPAGGGWGLWQAASQFCCPAMPVLDHFDFCLMHSSQLRCHSYSADAAGHHEAAIHANGRLDVVV